MEGCNLMFSLSTLNFHFPTGVIFTPEVFSKPTPTSKMELQLINSEVFNCSLFSQEKLQQRNLW